MSTHFVRNPRCHYTNPMAHRDVHRRYERIDSPSPDSRPPQSNRINPISDGIEWGAEWGEEIFSEEPFKARVATDIEDDRIRITVGDYLSVVDVTRQPLS